MNSYDEQQVRSPVCYFIVYLLNIFFAHVTFWFLCFWGSANHQQCRRTALFAASGVCGCQCYVCACHCVHSSAIIRVLGCVNSHFELQKPSSQIKAEDCTHVNLCCFVAAEYSLRVDGGFPTLHVVSIVRLSQLNSNGRYLFKRSLDSYFFSLPSSDEHCWPPRVLGCVMAKSCLRV